MSKSDRQKVEAAVEAMLNGEARRIASADTVRVNRAATNALAREHLFMEQLNDALRRLFVTLPRLKVEAPKKPRGRTRRILNLLISDTHYGSNLDPREVGYKYGPVEEARRTAAVVRQAANYKLDHREDTELYLHVMGDIIQGQLHDMRDGLPIAEQVAAAMRILVQAVRYLAVQFPRGVTVFCTPGNHGRNSWRHRDRATNQKWDAIETMIYSALQMACEQIPNVKVLLSYEPKYDFVLFGNVGMATHGDTVINPGYPNKSIDVAGIKKQADSINNARVSRKLVPYSLFIMGHVHVGSLTHLPGSIIVMTNGCLIPPDAYAQSIGIFDSACGQWLWESTADYPVGDARFATVDEETDKDASLDAIIKPFEAL